MFSLRKNPRMCILGDGTLGTYLEANGVLGRKGLGNTVI